MMTVETVKIEMVQEELGDFFKEATADDEDLEEFDAEKKELITQEIIDEINLDIGASTESYVPMLIWEVCAEEGIVPDDDGLRDKWVKWYEEKHA